MCWARLRDWRTNMTVSLHRGILQSGQHTFMVSDNIQPTPLHGAIFGWLSSSWLSPFKYGVWRPNTWSDGSFYFPYLSSVQSLSRVWLFATPWTAARQASLSITNSQSLPKLMSIESVMPSNHLTLCLPLLLSSIFPSIRVFSNESVLHIRWPKVLELQLQHQSFQWTPETDLL